MRMPVVVLSIVSLLFVVRVILAVYFAKATNKDWKKALFGCWRGLVLIPIYSFVIVKGIELFSK